LHTINCYYNCFINGISYNENSITKVNSENSILICNQTWMLNNLNVSRYRNGDIIPQVTNQKEWYGLKTGAWCYYNNDKRTAIYMVNYIIGML